MLTVIPGELLCNFLGMRLFHGAQVPFFNSECVQTALYHLSRVITPCTHGLIRMSPKLAQAEHAASTHRSVVGMMTVCLESGKYPNQMQSVQNLCVFVWVRGRHGQANSNELIFCDSLRLTTLAVSIQSQRLQPSQTVCVVLTFCLTRCSM